uniref:HAUS augmin-like complex subunit 6 N-terminal domain-containing protein n=1 Tax=Cuerna arida TaxID=1464854 RepID=A0A1B6FU65_9HEMI
MAAAEKLHELIHINLESLRDSGYKIDFEEGMFRQPNQSMFEKVGHALLMVLDPVECNKTIPWPLLEDKSLRSEFRNKFVKFIKMINSKYPQADIPEIQASRLHFPGGLHFLQFIYKLSSFAVWLELMRISSPQEMEELLPKFRPSKLSKDNVVKLNIVKGAHQAAKCNLKQVTEYPATALPLMQNLKSHDEKLCSKILVATKQLKNQITSLDVDNRIKEQLMNIENADAMKDWNARTDEKVAQLKKQAGRLVQLRDLTAECKRRKAAAARNSEDLCLDGSKLAISPALAEMVTSPVCNSNGDIRLMAVLKAGQAWAAGLVLETPNTSLLLPEAQELLKEYRELQARAVNLNAAVETSCNQSRRIISKLRPIIYAYIKQKPAPDHFKYLRAPPTLQFARPTSPSKPPSTVKKDKRRRWSDIVRKKKSYRRVVCSVKWKRPQTSMFDTPASKGFRHPSLASSIKRSTRHSTTQSRVPVYLATLPRRPHLHTLPHRPSQLGTLPRHSAVSATSTPASSTGSITCRKSLYGELPKGPKLEEIEDLSPLAEVSSVMIEPKEAVLSPLPVVEASPLSFKRKSICDLVERYRKLKKSMKANN